MDKEIPAETRQYIHEIVGKAAESIISRVDERLATVCGATEQDVRMSCVSLVAGLRGPHASPEETIQEADALATYILTGKKPGES